MTDTEKKGAQTIGPMNVEQLQNVFAFDTQRIWGNSIQVLLNPDHAMLIFREQVAVNTVSPDGETSAVTKNVASWVMPLDVARQLGEAISGLDFEAVKNVEPSV